MTNETVKKSIQCGRPKIFNIEDDVIKAEIDPNCGCVFEEVTYDFTGLCNKDRMTWFKAVKCRMIQKATLNFTAEEMGLISVGLITINPKTFFSEMKPLMTGKEIDNLINKHVKEGNTNCVFGRNK